MRLAKALETTRMHRVAGRTGARTAVVSTRPFRAPHHPIAEVGLIGGGQGPRPGEVSRAHHGILLLDELPACRRHVLEGLRQPLEERLTRISSPERPRSHRSSSASGTDHASRVALRLARTSLLVSSRPIGIPHSWSCVDMIMMCGSNSQANVRSTTHRRGST
jgi:hypothetical protein